jgi:protein-L-isoaspartate(D-aspartate) O-methyltransferase
MRQVGRRNFVPPSERHLAHRDMPLPIGWDQTISQPRLVEHMILLLDLRPGDRVLEVGTGSGYQTAVLAALGDVDVYSVEVIPPLADEAARRLSRLRFGNVHLLVGDGYLGWPACAPYDAIVVTAAPDHVPPPLIEQLAEGGRLVLPIGPAGGVQMLWLIVKQDGRLRAKRIAPVLFVPLIRPTLD